MAGLTGASSHAQPGEGFGDRDVTAMHPGHRGLLLPEILEGPSPILSAALSAEEPSQGWQRLQAPVLCCQEAGSAEGDADGVISSVLAS